MLQVLPRMTLAAKQTFVLLRYWLRDVVGYLEIDADDGNGVATFGLISSGTQGATLTSEPQIFRDASSSFTVADVGRYLVTYGDPNVANRGIWKIVSVPDANTLILAASVYGPRFISAVSIDWHIVDVVGALGPGTAFTTFQAPANSGTSPAWQVHFENQAADTTLIRFDVGPIGGWSIATHTWVPGTPTTTVRQFNQDATPVWYFLADTTHITAWTENTAGTAVFDAMQAGSGQTFRPGFDPSFALAADGLPNVLPGGLLDSLQSTDSTNSAMVDFVGCRAATNFVAAPNDSILSNLADSAFDLRRDVVDVVIASESGVVPSEIRGLMRCFRHCSTLIPYRQFVANSRGYVSLGLGLCVEWNGSLVV